ncbi:MAG: outer membrane lipoprotein-sorting protein [Cytophagales bacterium]|nr:MAG: outer membrane lipoprotein-sorting protein [Cytophagales bacterium]
MKLNKFGAVAFGLILSAGAYAQTVDEIVDKHVAALGGMDKLNAVKTMTQEQSISVAGMEIPVKTFVVVGKSVKTESSIMGNAMISVVDNGVGWMIRPAMMGGTGEPEDMPAEQLKQTAGQLDPFGSLVSYKTKGNTVELVGKEKSGKNDVYHLKVTTKNGTVSDQFLDANTHLLSKVKANVNGQESEIDFSDYKEYEGIKLASTMEMDNPQAGRMSFITNKVVINGPIDEAIFKKPAK